MPSTTCLPYLIVNLPTGKLQKRFVQVVNFYVQLRRVVVHHSFIEMPTDLSTFARGNCRVSLAPLFYLDLAFKQVLIT